MKGPTQEQIKAALTKAKTDQNTCWVCGGHKFTSYAVCESCGTSRLGIIDYAESANHLAAAYRASQRPGAKLGGIMGIIVIGMLSAIVILLLLSGLIASVKLLMGVMG